MNTVRTICKNEKKYGAYIVTAQEESICLVTDSNINYDINSQETRFPYYRAVRYAKRQTNDIFPNKRYIRTKYEIRKKNNAKLAYINRKVVSVFSIKATAETAAFIRENIAEYANGNRAEACLKFKYRFQNLQYQCLTKNFGYYLVQYVDYNMIDKQDIYDAMDDSIDDAIAHYQLEYLDDEDNNIVAQFVQYLKTYLDRAVKNVIEKSVGVSKYYAPFLVKIAFAGLDLFESDISELITVDKNLTKTTIMQLRNMLSVNAPDYYGLLENEKVHVISEETPELILFNDDLVHACDDEHYAVKALFDIYLDYYMDSKHNNKRSTLSINYLKEKIAEKIGTFTETEIQGLQLSLRDVLSKKGFHRSRIIESPKPVLCCKLDAAKFNEIYSEYMTCEV